jgi:predicted ArsR family transcriptional regulator
MSHGSTVMVCQRRYASEAQTDERAGQADPRRVRAGERVIDLADEFGVNRKTIRRRLDALERAETKRAERIAAKRLRTQAARERRKLLERERAAGLSASDRLNADSGTQAGGRLPRERARVHDPYLEWLDTRKNLSGRALAEANGLVYVRNAEGTIRTWCERSEVDALLDAGWLPA